MTTPEKTISPESTRGGPPACTSRFSDIIHNIYWSFEPDSAKSSSSLRNHCNTEQAAVFFSTNQARPRIGHSQTVARCNKTASRHIGSSTQRSFGNFIGDGISTSEPPFESRQFASSSAVFLVGISPGLQATRDCLTSRFHAAIT